MHVTHATGFEQMATKPTNLPPATAPPLIRRTPVSPGQMTSVGLIFTKPRTSLQCIAVVTPATQGKGPLAPLRLFPLASLTLTEEGGAPQPQRLNSLPSFVLNRQVIPWKCTKTNLLKNVTLNKADPALSCHQEPQKQAMQRKKKNVHPQMSQELTLHVSRTE